MPSRTILLAVLYAVIIAGYQSTALVRAYLGVDPGDKAVSYLFRAAVLSLAIFVLLKIRLRWAPRVPPIAALLLVLFWSLYLARVVVDTELLPYTNGTMPVNYLAYAAGVCLVPALACAVVPDARGLRLALYLIMALLAVVCATTLVIPQARDFLLRGGRMGLDTLNPISLGHCGTTLALLSAYWLLGSKRLGAMPAGFGGGLFALGVFTLIPAGSRGPLVALVVALAILFVWSLRHANARSATRLFMLTLLFSGALVLVGNKLPFLEVGSKLILERTEIAEFDTSRDGRVTAIRDALRQFNESPILGSSVVEQNSGSYPHNVIVEAFMATGILGGTAFVALIVTASLACVRILRSCQDAVWVVLVFVQNLVAAMFSGGLWDSGVFWASLIAVLAIARSLESRHYSRNRFAATSASSGARFRAIAS